MLFKMVEIYGEFIGFEMGLKWESSQQHNTQW